MGNQKNVWRIWPALCMAWTVMVPSHAQSTAEANLGTVTVMGQVESFTQPSIARAAEQLKTIPGGVAVVDLNAVREGRQSTWTDSLGFAPGVYIQDRFGSEEARLSIRGSALSRTFHSFGTKVMQDGVPINYADGFFDMQTVDPSASRYVEVLRGPNATTYGATTLGGAINFVAPTGYSDPGRVVRAEVGSFGYNKLFGSAAGVLRAQEPGGPVWDYNVSGSNMQQDGFRDHAQMGSQKLLGNAGVKVDRNLESRFYVAVVRSRTQLPGYLTKAELQADPSMANSSQIGSVYPYREEANRRRDVDAQRLANKTTLRDGNTEYEVAAYAMNYSLWHPIDTLVEQNAQTQGGHFKATHFGPAHQLTLAYLPSVGVTTGSSRPSNNQGAATGSATSRYQQKSNNQSAFIEDKYRLSAHTTLVSALQYDSARRDVQDAVLLSNNSEHRFAQWSPRVGVLHEITPQHQLFASLSRNFEAPIFGLTGTTTLANQAQSGATVELGSRGHATLGRDVWAWDATVYRIQLRNEFQTSCSNPPNCTTFTTQNIASTVHQGLELGVNYLHKKTIDSRLALLYSDFHFDHNPYYGNNAMPGFPPVIVRAEALYRAGAEVAGKPSFYAGPKLEWAPRAAPMDNTNSLYNDAYAVWGFKMGQAVSRQWSWFVDARNLSNKKYAGTTNISADYSTTNKATLAAYYPGDGRALYAGVQAQFD
jgi:iron complex outermembrane recepter protein